MTKTQIQVSKRYKFRIQVGRELLNYTGIVIGINQDFLTFKDKFGDIFNYNLNTVISYKEIQ